MKSAGAVRNMASIVTDHVGDDVLLVVSAMGKTTNMLEKALADFRAADGELGREALAPLIDYHMAIVDELFGGDTAQPVYGYVSSWFDDLYSALRQTSLDYDCQYDQTVSYGELISTTIVREYLKYTGLRTRWIDSRKYVVTDCTWRAANVDWDETRLRISRMGEEHRPGTVFIAQGFIGGPADGSRTTTLGREGSDYTAAIFANSLDAEDVTIWKDVDGLLSADPKRFETPVKIPHITYSEAIELSFYGATIIHPKTLKPLQNKGIALKVQSFVHPDSEPSVIDGSAGKQPDVTSYIVKDNQTLASFSPRDYSFMNEHNLQILFSAFDRLHIHANMVQTSALMLSICFDHDEAKLKALVSSLSKQFSIKYNRGLQLFTVRHFGENDPVADAFLACKRIIVKQSSRSTLQYVLKLPAE